MTQKSKKVNPTRHLRKTFPERSFKVEGIDNSLIYNRLTKNGLILDFKAHRVVRALSNGKDVWWNLY